MSEEEKIAKIVNRVDSSLANELSEKRGRDVDIAKLIKAVMDSLDGESLNTEKTPKPGIILIGSEAHGLSTELEKHITSKLTIPMISRNELNAPESLNASVACAIICYALKINSTN